LLETHQLTRVLFETVSQHLASQGLLLKEGTIVDATLIAASPLIKNREDEHDPEMHLSKKGNQWHFWINVHIGVHATSGLVHSVVVTAANVADVTKWRSCCMERRTRFMRGWQVTAITTATDIYILHSQ